jgi:hypothetical protein
MRLCAAIMLLVTTLGCGAVQQYEYEEEMYLALDGSATIWVHSSIAALNALRGTTFDVNPARAVDRDAVRAHFTTSVTRVNTVKASRRLGRRFVHVQIEVDDVRRLGEAPPFAWSSYRFAPAEESMAFDQQVGAPAEQGATPPTLTGDEIVAFRVHVPSKVVYHNAGETNLRRGNILAWEQRLTDRLRGVPLTFEARMEPRSILYRTLWLFAGTLVAVALSFAAVIWLVVRRGPRAVPQT